MSKVLDVSDPGALSDDDLRYAFDRGLITEEVMAENLSAKGLKKLPHLSSDAADTTVDDDEGFDPAEHSVDEVNDYIDEHPDEADAILAAEQRGKGRKGIMER